MISIEIEESMSYYCRNNPVVSIRKVNMGGHPRTQVLGPIGAQQHT